MTGKNKKITEALQINVFSVERTPLERHPGEREHTLPDRQQVPVYTNRIVLCVLLRSNSCLDSGSHCSDTTRNSQLTRCKTTSHLSSLKYFSFYSNCFKEFK